VEQPLAAAVAVMLKYRGPVTVVGGNTRAKHFVLGQDSKAIGDNGSSCLDEVKFDDGEIRSTSSRRA
jgi:hypothetical protein